MKAISYCNKIIRYSFYSLFFLVPLVFFGNTSELFEFNKMWLTFGLTIIIAAAWVSKMIIGKKILIKKTPLDIPVILFLSSQIISTIFSLDSHVSLWGYYSRFNGGLLSLISYILLYYALVSNLELKHVVRILSITLISGLFTALWGFPSHFGFDPTCFVFRGSLDTNCWTEAFKPTIRAFSTLGQPAWFAAYLNILLPLSIVCFLINTKNKINPRSVYYFLLATLFYTCLIFANTRAGNAAFYVADIIFWIILFYKKIFNTKTLLKYLLLFHFVFAVCNFFFGAPIGTLNKFTFPALQKKLFAHAQTIKPTTAKQPALKTTGITDSAQIRLIVWKGAIDAWKAYPIFGTGVETFAFAYYRFRPAEHNLTSEWDYLYNKAHNEYLNYLTTTGIVGLGTYLSIISIFFFITIKYLFSYKNPSTNESSISKTRQHFLLILALLAGYITILITNFFGFSVVIINLYFFLIPGFFFLLVDMLKPNKNYEFALGSVQQNTQTSINALQWILIITTIIIAGNCLLGLFRYWYADTVYALGYNLDRSSSFQQAFPLLQNAVSIEPNEPVYKDELAINLATLAQIFYLQKDASTGAQLANEAINIDNQVIARHPNNIVFWKNRLRIFYGLANGDKQNQTTYLTEALKAINKSSELAPTDARTWFNLGTLIGQTNSLEEGVKILKKTIKLKPDYQDAYSTLGEFYHQLALGETIATTSAATQEEKIVNPQMQQKAIDTYQYILNNLSPNDVQLKKTLESWKKDDF